MKFVVQLFQNKKAFLCFCTWISRAACRKIFGGGSLAIIQEVIPAFTEVHNECSCKGLIEPQEIQIVE